MFATIHDVRALIASHQTLIVAGEEELLRSLPRGNWIGGTIPYFMTADGGRTSRDGIFVETIPAFARARRAIVYDQKTIPNIGRDADENGYTVLILPAFSAIHQQYALEAPQYESLFLKVIAGWISGIHLDDLGRCSPQIFDGASGQVFGDRGVALHVELPASHRAQIGIVNIFEPGDGDEIKFPQSGFEATSCTINGEPRNFHDYFVASRLEVRLPLVADFCGALINVSIQGLDAKASKVKFYAPVFEGVSYRFAKPVGNYAQRFAEQIPTGIKSPVFTCNCVLNYLYGELEQRRTGNLQGPMTFGEIAYQLLNQTLVHVTVSEAS
jgi:hypothetical protein